MSESTLDQIVKGAPSPSSFPSGAPSSPTPILPASADPLASLPSSPPQIYLNLLILEASLRAQYLELRARRRQYTFFLTLLGLWILYFGYALFLAPREDGSGVGGSVYWVVEVTEKVCLMAGVVTGLLVWGTGQWERGIKWPRRWVGTTNRGLRGFNCKIVVVRGPWWKEWRSTLMFFISNGLLLNGNPSTYRYIPPSVLAMVDTKFKNPISNIQDDSNRPRPHGGGHYEDLSPGGDIIALLLLPKPFSASFRENWDLYRTAYWESENTRRASILRKLRAHERHLRSQQSWWNRWRHPLRDVEKSPPSSSSHSHSHSHSHSQTHKIQSAEKRLHSGSSSHSRTSSRSSTPTREQDDAPSRRGSAGSGGAGRRGSSSASERRVKKPAVGAPRVQKMTAASSTLSHSSTASGSTGDTGSGQSSRSGTPTMVEHPKGSGRLVREGSSDSVESLGGGVVKE